MARKLTKKQRGFVKDIIRTGNGTESALNNYEIKSEDKKRVAASIASENLTKPEIQAFIKELVANGMITNPEVAMEGMNIGNVRELVEKEMAFRQQQKAQQVAQPVEAATEEPQQDIRQTIESLRQELSR